MPRDGHRRGIALRLSGPPSASHTALLLPDILATAPFYDDLMAPRRGAARSIRMVAVTLPGFGGTPRLRDDSLEELAALAGNLAAEFAADVIVGHGLGADIAVEVVASGRSTAALLLLSPALSRRDLPRLPRLVSRLGPGLGTLAAAAALRLSAPAARRRFPADRRAALAAELRRNRPSAVASTCVRWSQYLDQYHSLAPWLCEAGGHTTVVFGEQDSVGTEEAERRRLEECPGVQLVTLAGAGHFMMVEQPDEVVRLLVDLVAQTTGGRRSSPLPRSTAA